MKALGTKLPWYAMGDPWLLTQTEWMPEKNTYFETIFTQSNGYMGVRGYTEEVNDGVSGSREGYLAGVFGEVYGEALKQVRVDYGWRMVGMITLPEVFACEIELNSEPFKLSHGRILSFRRTLNMRNGVGTTYL
jgi:trehalose/maltose hydrolase-like predicted phosphorylase